MDPTAASPEELLAHAQWLRKLALRLATDEASAEDLVQETWLAALRRPPRRGGARRWLQRVLTNAARQRLRSASRRTARETEVGGETEEGLSPADLAARLEQEQRLLAAVAGLRDPYKTVVLLRYEEGLSAVEIARRNGVPAATVRTQLHRAVEELRARMDDGPGGRRAWAILLAPGASLAKTGGAFAAMEMIGMSSTTKNGLASAAVLLALVGTWRFGADSQDEPLASVPAAVEGAPVAVAPAPKAEPSEAAPHREALAAPTPPPPVVPAVHRFEARIVDGNGTPVAGASVGWSDGQVDSPPSQNDGLVRLAVDPAGFGERGTLRVGAPGYVALELEVTPDDGERTWLGDVALIGGAVVSGLVVDTDGNPLAGARVVLTWASSLKEHNGKERREGPSVSDLWDGAEETTTDLAGRFELRSFETGTRMLWAGARESLWTTEGPFPIAAGEAREFRLTLEEAPRELRITGTVLDPSGLGVPRAHLWFYDDPRRGKRSGKADEVGHFDLLLQGNAPHQLRAVDPEGRYPEASLADVAPGSTGVVLQFVETRRLEIVAAGAHGQPLLVESLYATNEADDNIIATGEESVTLEKGSFLLEPSEAFYVKIQAEGHAEGRFGPFRPGGLEARSEFQLEPIAPVSGIVRHDGRPVAGARAELYMFIGENQVVYNRGFRVTRYPFSFEKATTDAEGRFTLTPRDGTDFYVRVATDGLAPAEQQVRDYDPQRGADLVFDLTAGGVLHGLVLAAPGEEPTGLMVAVSRGDANERTLRVGPDGTFRFEHLMPGRWLAEVLVDDMSDAGATFMGARTQAELEWNVEVHEGEEAYVELDLARQVRALLEGVVQVDGHPAAGWSVGLWPVDRPSGRPSEFPKATLDEHGRFRLETPVLGAQTLRLTAGDGALDLEAELTLTDGPQDWSLELETGAVEVTNVPTVLDEYYRPHLRWKGEAGLSARLPLRPDEDGVARLERVPAGRLELVDHPGGPRTAPVVIEGLELQSGARAELALP